MSLFIGICEYVKVKIVTSIMLKCPKGVTNVKFPRELFSMHKFYIVLFQDRDSANKANKQIRWAHFRKDTERMDMSLQAPF